MWSADCGLLSRVLPTPSDVHVAVRLDPRGVRTPCRGGSSVHHPTSTAVDVDARTRLSCFYVRYQRQALKLAFVRPLRWFSPRLFSLAPSPALRDVRPTPSQDCFQEASYGLASSSGRPFFCPDHKTDGMTLACPRSCATPGCCKVPGYGVDGKRQVCRDHKTEAMTCAVLTCESPLCNKNPSFAPRGETRRRFCKRHAQPGMVNVYYKYCGVARCPERASFEAGGKLRCLEHCEAGMKPRNNICRVEGGGCIRQSSYGIEGGKPVVCTLHKVPGMVQVRGDVNLSGFFLLFLRRLSSKEHVVANGFPGCGCCCANGRVVLLCLVRRCRHTCGRARFGYSFEGCNTRARPSSTSSVAFTYELGRARGPERDNIAISRPIFGVWT